MSSQAVGNRQTHRRNTIKGAASVFSPTQHLVETLCPTKSRFFLFFLGQKHQCDFVVYVVIDGIACVSARLPTRYAACTLKPLTMQSTARLLA